VGKLVTPDRPRQLLDDPGCQSLVNQVQQPLARKVLSKRPDLLQCELTADHRGDGQLLVAAFRQPSQPPSDDVS